MEPVTEDERLACPPKITDEAGAAQSLALNLRPEDSLGAEE